MAVATLRRGEGPAAQGNLTGARRHGLVVHRSDVHAESPLCSARIKLASGVRGDADFALNGTAQGVLEGFLDRSDPTRSGLEGGVGRPPNRRYASL